MALSILKRAGELYAITPRESELKLLMFPQDWLTYFPAETCAIKLRDDSKPDIPKIQAWLRAFKN